MRLDLFKCAMALAAGAFAITTLASNSWAQDNTASTGALAVTRDSLKAIPADDLKRAYLICERAAAHTRLDHATMLTCSLLHEELRERVFGGSFDALVNWWRESNGVDTAIR